MNMPAFGIRSFLGNPQVRGSCADMAVPHPHQAPKSLRGVPFFPLNCHLLQNICVIFCPCWVLNRNLSFVSQADKKGPMDADMSHACAEDQLPVHRGGHSQDLPLGLGHDLYGGQHLFDGRPDFMGRGGGGGRKKPKCWYCLITWEGVSWFYLGHQLASKTSQTGRWRKPFGRSKPFFAKPWFSNRTAKYAEKPGVADC